MEKSAGIAPGHGQVGQELRFDFITF
jgi:hypothetical protein